MSSENPTVEERLILLKPQDLRIHSSPWGRTPPSFKAHKKQHFLSFLYVYSYWLLYSDNNNDTHGSGSCMISQRNRPFTSFSQSLISIPHNLYWRVFSLLFFFFSFLPFESLNEKRGRKKKPIRQQRPSSFSPLWKKKKERAVSSWHHSPLPRIPPPISARFEESGGRYTSYHNRGNIWVLLH